MPIFKEEKSKREKIAKQWLIQASRTQQIKPSDLCSHKYLLKKANIFFKEEPNELIENLEKMVDLMKEMVSERNLANKKEPSIEDEEKLKNLIIFMNHNILKIEECKSYSKFCEGSEGITMPDGFAEIKPIDDFSVICCSYLVTRIKKLIQANTFKYISWVCQLFLVQFRDFLILECFQAKNEPLVFSLVLMCAALQKAGLPYFRDEGFRSLVYIINRISHIPTIQHSIILLNVYESSYPYNEIECNEIQLKMLNWSEITYHAVFDNQAESECQPKVYIDFEPEKAFPKKFEKFQRTNEANLSDLVDKLVQPQASAEDSENEGDGIFGNIMAESTQKSENMKPPSKLFCFVSIDLNAITNLPKALQVRQRQEDSSVTNEEKISMLRDGAIAILEWSYKQVYDQVQLKGQLLDRILPWDEYNKKYEKFIETGLLPLIESDIVHALSAKNNQIELLNLGFNSIKKIAGDRYYMFQFVNKEYFQVSDDPLNLTKRKNQFKSGDFLSNCIMLVEKSVDIQAKQLNSQNQIKQQNQNVYITCKFWKILSDLIEQVDFWEAYDESKKLHGVIQKLLEKNDNSSDKTNKSKPYIIKLLNQSNQFIYKGDSLSELTIQQGEEASGVKIAIYLINNQDFQYSLWKVAGQLYYKLKRITYRLHEYDSAQEHDLFKLCFPMKKELDEICYTQLSKFPLTLQQENVIILNQKGVVEEICNLMISSQDSWERTFDRANQDNVREQDNFKKLVDLLRANIKALTHNEAFSISSTCFNQQTIQKIKISDSRLIYNVEQLINKIQEHLGNAGDNMSNFQEAIAEVFSSETFENFINLTENNKKNHTKDLSVAWDTFSKFLSECLEKTPTIIDKMIENGDLKRVLNFLCEKVAPVQKTWFNVMQFLNKVASNEKAVDLIKESQIFEKYIMPNSDDVFKKIAIITANLSNGECCYDDIQKLINQSDYFFQQTKKALVEIFQSIIMNTKILQKKYYEYMENYFNQNDSGQSSLVDENNIPQTRSYSQFLIQIREQLADTDEFYFLKFQVFKLKTLFQYHTSNFFSTQKKLLALPDGSTEIPLYTQFQEIKTLLYTIQPLYEYQKDFYSCYSSDKFSLFKEISSLESTIFYLEEKPEKNIYTHLLFEYFESFMKQQKESILEIVNAVNDSADKKQVTEFEEIEWIDLMSKIGKISHPIEFKKDSLVAEINIQNVRGHLIARKQAIYLLFKDFSENDCYPRRCIFWKNKNWTYLFKELKSLETSFINCQIQCKSFFFQNLNQLAQNNYVSQNQKQILDLVLKEGITYEEESEVKQQSQLEDTFQNLREDLLFFHGNNQDMTQILSSLINSYNYLTCDYSDQMDKQYQEHKKFVQKQNFDIQQIIISLENNEKQGFNNPNFISLLSNLQEPLQKQQDQIYYIIEKAEDFFKFIHEDKLYDLMKLFIYLRKIDPLSLIKDKSFVEQSASQQEITNSFSFQAYLSYQDVCCKLSDILCQFINIYDERVTIDQVKENGVYNDQQEFYCNYFYQLARGLLYSEGYSRIETQEQKEQSLQWLNQQEQAPQLYKNLIVNLDLRKVQTNLVNKMGNIFNSFTHLMKKEVKIEDKPAEEEKKEENKIEQESKKEETDVKTEEEIKVAAEVEQQEIKKEDIQETVAEKTEDNIVKQEDKKTDEQVQDDKRTDENQIQENKLDEQKVEEIKEKTQEEKEQEQKDLEKKAEEEKKEAERKAEEEKKEAEKKAEEERIQKEKEEAERLKKEQIEKDRAKIRPTLITIDEFYKFMEFMQKSFLQVTRQWANQKQTCIKIYDKYISDLISNDILPETPSLKELKESFYEPAFTQLVSNIDQLKGFALFGGDNQDFDKAVQLLSQIDKLLQLVFRLSNKVQLREYFEKIKNNDQINKHAFMKNVINLHNILIDGQINPSQKEFNQIQQNLYGRQRWPNILSHSQKKLFQNQAQILKDKTAQQKQSFLVLNLELIFRCLQVFRIFEQKYVGKISNLQKKLEEISKKSEEEQKITLKGEYSTKVISYVCKIQDLSDQQFGSKTLQYILGYKNHLPQFDLPKDGLEEVQDLLASINDASQFIQMINKKILQNFKEQPSLKEILENVQIDKTPDLDQGLGSIETNEPSLQLTTASGTINLTKIQSAVFSADLLKDQFAHIMKKMLEVKARKQFQFRMKQEKKEIQELDEIEILEKDSEFDFQKFVKEFSEQILGNGGINEIGSCNKPQSEDSTKLFTQIMQQAIPVFCQVTIPTKVVSENLEKSIISLKKEVIEDINSKKAEVENEVLNDNEIKLYENLMGQLNSSGKLWLQKVNQTWLEEGQYQEDIRNWHNSVMLILRSISCLARTSLNKQSTLLNKILNDFNDECSLMKWFMNVYLPIRLLGDHTFKVINENIDPKDEKKKEKLLETTVFMIADYNQNIENNVERFLNELTGYGLFQSESVKSQRKLLRQKIIECCIQSIQDCVNRNSEEQGKGFLSLPLMEKSKVLGSIMIIYYLMNQQNNVESAQFLFAWKSENQISFLKLISNLLGQAQWLTQVPFVKELTSGTLKKSELLSKLTGITTQAFACQVIDRGTQLIYYFNKYQSDTLKMQENKLNKEKKDRLKKKKEIKNEASSEQLSDNQGPIDSIQLSPQKLDEIQIEDSDIISEEEENYSLPPSYTAKTKEENQIVSESQDPIPEKKEVENNAEEQSNQNREEEENEGEPWEITNQRDQFLQIDQRHRRQLPENDQNDNDDARLFLGIYPRVQRKPKSLEHCNFQTKNHMYSLEFDIMGHHINDYGSDCTYRDFCTTKDNIQNHLPQIFQNLKPLSLSNYYELGNIIEQFFFTQKANRDKRQIDLQIKEQDEKKEIFQEKQVFDEYADLESFIYGGKWTDLNSAYERLYSHQSNENNDERKKEIIQTLNTIDDYQKFIGITGLGFKNQGLINLKQRAIQEKQDDKIQDDVNEVKQEESQIEENKKEAKQEETQIEENKKEAKQEETQIEENKKEAKQEETQIEENNNEAKAEEIKTQQIQVIVDNLDTSIDSDTQIYKEKDLDTTENITQILQSLIDQNIAIILQSEDQKPQEDATEQNEQKEKPEEKKEESAEGQADKTGQIVENTENQENTQTENQDNQIVENKIQQEPVTSTEQNTDPSSTEQSSEVVKDSEPLPAAEIDQAPEAKAEEAKAEEAKAEEAKVEDEKPGQEAKEPENISLSDFVAQIKDPVIRRQLLLDLTKEDIENLNDEQKEELNKLKADKKSKEKKTKTKKSVDPAEQTFQTLLNDYFMQTHQGFQGLKQRLLIPLCDYQPIDDDVVQNLLINVLFNDFRNLSYQCVIQFIESDTKQSQNQEIKYKFINAVIFLLQITLNMNQNHFFQVLQVPNDKIQIKQQQWHKIFMRLSFCLQNFLEKGPKIAQELLDGFIKPDKEFHGKRDQNIKIIDEILNQSQNIDINSNKTSQPPFITFIKMMHDLLDEHDKLKKSQSLNEQQTKILQDTKTKSDIIQRLITEVLKQFDCQFGNDDAKFQSHVIELKKQALEIQKQENFKACTTFGILTNESIKTLTEITKIQNASKKMSKALNNIMLRVSSLSVLDFYICNKVKELQSDQINQYSNLTIDLDLNPERQQFNSIFKNASDQAAKICQQNFSQIISKEKQIGQESLAQMIDFIWNINDITGCHELPSLQQQSSLPKLEKTLSQQDTLKQQMTLSSKTKKIEQIKKLTVDEKKEVKDQMEQMKEKMKPFTEVLQVLNNLLLELVQNKEKNEKLQQKLQKDIESKQKIHQQLLSYLQSENKSAEQEIEIKAYEQKVVKIIKEIEENMKLKSFIQLSVKLQNYQINQIHEFYKEDELLDFVEQSNQFIQFAQQVGDDFEPINEGAKVLFNIIFLSFYPELLLEIIQNQNKKNDTPSSINESKYVKMEKIEKADDQTVQAIVAGPIESKTLIRMSTQVVRTATKTTQLLVFKSDIEQVSERLEIFNSFCLKNKELLNKIVKQSLEKSEKSEMISLLKYMPNLLTMENKQQLFWNEIKKMETYEYFEPEIKRDDIFMDSFDKFIYEPKKMLQGRFKIRFFDEPGYDAGGVRRDFFSKISQQIFNQDLGLFTLSDNGSTYKINPRSSVQLDYVNYYKFIGRIIAKAIYEHCQLECYFISSIYKMIIGQQLCFKDLQDIDNNLFTGLNWCLLPSSDVEPLYETFSIDHDYFGQSQTIDIVSGGSQIDLTNDNKEYYVERKAYFLLYKQVQKQMDAFLEGFYDVIPREVISIFTYKELEILISGSPDYTIADLKANTEYENGYNEKTKQIVWFWEIMETLNSTDKANFLQFVTGSSKVPVQGFALLWGMGGPQKFTISRISGSENYQLPVAHTCYNQIDLPEYSTKEMLEEKLLWAIKEAQGFGFG